MDFSNLAVIGSTLLAPSAVMAYAAFRGSKTMMYEARIGLVLFAMAIVSSIFGTFSYEAPIRLEMLWASTAEPSGYFEFSLVLFWIRYLWILLSVGLLAGLILGDSERSLQTQERGLRFLFLSGTFLFSALAFLSENVFLTLMFVEMTVFLIHSFGIKDGEKELELEMVSYFKRSTFIFVSLLVMLILSSTGFFSLSSVTLIGVVLYVVSFILSKHSFSDWRYVTLTLIHATTVFFIIGRVVREDMLVELWFPLTAIFLLAAVIFSALGFLSASSLGSVFWYLFAVVCTLITQRISSARPEDPFWGVHEAVSLAFVFVQALLLRVCSKNSSSSQKFFSVVASVIQLGLLLGAIPSVDIGGARASSESIAKLVILGSLAFSLAALCGKMIFSAFSEAKSSEDLKKYPQGVIAFFIVFSAYILTNLRMIDVYGESPYRLGVIYLLTSSYVLVSIGASVCGFVIGSLLGSNGSFHSWKVLRDRRLETLFPRIDSTVIRWNEKVAESPGQIIDWTNKGLGVGLEGAATWIKKIDQFLFADKLYSFWNRLARICSEGLRITHSGSLQWYLLVGTFVVIAGTFLFLMEGR